MRDLLALAATQPQRYPCLPESAAFEPARARYDVLLAFPQEALILAQDGHVGNARGADPGSGFLETLDKAWSVERASANRSAKDTSTHFPFRGGCAVFLDYEIAAEIEPSVHMHRSSETALPAAMALRCPAAIIVDRLEQKRHVIAETEFTHCLDAMIADLAAAASYAAIRPGVADICEDDPTSFLDGVARIHEYLRAGEVFQVNLSREWRANFDELPALADLYAALRAVNPAPFAGLLQRQDWAIVSSSPERLVEIRGDCDRGRRRSR